MKIKFFSIPTDEGRKRIKWGKRMGHVGRKAMVIS